MAVRVADSLKQQNDLKSFPVAYSEDIWLDQNKGKGDADYKDLQTLYNENKLGGSGLPEPESADKVLVSASSNTRADGLEWKQVSKNDVGLQLPEFESLEEWDSLPAEEKSKYYNAGKGYVVIKEDVKGAKGVIDDTKPNSTVTTLSAKKINDSLVDLEPLHKRIANPTPKDLNAILEEGTYSIGSLFEYENAPKDVSSFGNLIVTVGKIYITQEWLSGNDVSGSAWRTYRDNTSWSDWRYVATMDKVAGKSKISTNLGPNQTFTLDDDTVAIIIDNWLADGKTENLVTMMPANRNYTWGLGGSDYKVKLENRVLTNLNAGLYLQVLQIK